MVFIWRLIFESALLGAFVSLGIMAIAKVIRRSILNARRQRQIESEGK